MRLFVAVDLPEEVKGILEGFCNPLRAFLPRARWVKRAALHSTLAFLGETEAGLIPAVVDGLQKKLEQVAGFGARVAGVGTFPPHGRVRTVWLGLEPAAGFERLAGLVREGLSAAGVACDSKPFRAHITLARCDPPWPAALRTELSTLARAAASAAEFAAASFPCDRVTLFSSLLQSGGPIYSVEAEFRLQRADP